jgi:hypothetical protein
MTLSGYAAFVAAALPALLLAAGCGGSSSSAFEQDSGRELSGGGAGEANGGTEAGVAGASGSAGNANSAGKSGDAGGANGGNAGSAGTDARGGTAGTGASKGDAGGGNAGEQGNAGSGAGPGSVEPDPDCTQGVAPTPQLRRLTNEQYDRTVGDLLGVTSLTGSAEPLSSGLPPYQAGVPTEIDQQAYRVVAESVAAQVVGDPALRAKFLACTPSEADASCWHDTIVKFGRRAFRRPLSSEEVANFELLVGELLATDTEADAIADELLAAFLVAPSFLLRSELGDEPAGQGTYRLSSYEVASRLSYMLWASLPDPELDAAADAGELATQEQIFAQAERMLAHDRARYVLQAFHRSYLWLGPTGYWASIIKDPERFPGFDENVAASLVEETERYLDAVVFRDRGTFQQLFTSTLGFVNASTAPIYGLDPSPYGSELQEVELDSLERRGVLTRAGFLAAFATFDKPSPILRGAFVMKFVLDADMPEADPSMPTTPPPSGEARSNREYIEALTSVAACGDCHTKYINPPGFVLEAYDAIGAWQTIEYTGFPVDTVADVLIDGFAVTVTDPADLMSRLARSVDAQRNYVRKWLAHAYERSLDPLDACSVEQLTAKLRGENYTILELVRDLTQTDAFRLRATARTP